MKKMMKSLMAAIGVALTMTGSVFAANVAKIGENGYATLQAAIDAANKMTGDVTVEIYGKAETTGVGLSGTYDSITFVGTTDDAEICVNGVGYIDARSNDSSINFKNLTLRKINGSYVNDGRLNEYFSTYSAGTVTYIGCTFPTGVCALGSGDGKTVKFSGCNFNNTTSGKYSLWIDGNETKCVVENSQFNGVRGIKLFAENGAKFSEVTVTGTTFSSTITEKHAIVLTRGESIALTGNTYNNTKGIVEVDDDYASEINGKSVSIEGAEYIVDSENKTLESAVANVAFIDTDKDGVKDDGEIGYGTLADAVDAANSGDTILLKAGEYELPLFANKELTFKGESKVGVIINDAPDAKVQGWNGSTFHFENLTAKGARANYHGLANGVVAVTYKDCIIKGLRFLYAHDVSFDGCQFEADGVEHSFWTYGASNVAVSNCNFSYTDRAVNCYRDNGAEHELDIVFTDCTFTYAGTAEAPAGAVEINSCSVKSIELAMNGCTAPEKGAMWWNSQWDSKKGENTAVSVNGESVWPLVAEVNGVQYADLQKAIDAAKAGDTITLLRDVTASEIITIDKAITLDGNGKTLTSTAGRAINVSGADGVTIKNLTINASGERAINIIQSATNVTIENVTATAANYTVNVASSAPNAKVTITNSTLNGLCTVNVAAAGANVTVDNSTVNCNDNNTTAGESYAALNLNKEATNGKIVATNTTVNVTEGSDSTKGRNSAENGIVTINGSAEGVTVTVAVITYAGSSNYHGFTTLADAIEFAKAGDTITLLRDVTASEIITIDKAITLDGNGKTLTSTAGRAINVSGADGVTIKNLTINASGERAINIIQNATNVTIENVTATAANYTVNVASSAPNAVVAITNSNLTGLNVVNVAAAGANVTITGGTITCNDQNAEESYSALALNNDAKSGTITATGVTFDIKDDSAKATNQAEGGTVTIDGSTDGVDVDVACIFYGGNYWYGFTSLDAAIKKAQAGDTITLIRDVTITEKLTIEKNLTIDGNGKILTYTGSDRAIDVPNTANGANLTITDLTVEFTGGYSQRGINYNTTGNLTLDGVTVNGGDYVTYAVNLPSSSAGATVEIKNSSITGLIALNVWGKNATVTATNSHFTSKDNNTAENYAAVKLNSNGTDSAEGATITIIGGSITATDENGNPSSATTNATASGVINISDTTVVTGNRVETVAIVLYAGANEFYSCNSLQDAIEKATDDSKATVKLLKDVEESVTIAGTVVLDLNGKTITSAVSTIVVDGGKLTVQDSGDAGKIISTNAGGEAIAIKGGGTVILEGGYVYNPAYAVYLYSSENNAFVMNGGTVESEGTGIYAASANGSVKMNGGTVNSDYMAFGIYAGSLDITGGTVIADSYLMWNWGTGPVSISGGTFSKEPNVSYIKDGYTYAANDNGTYTVKPGSIKIGEVEYLTLDAAFKAAKAGDIITVNEAGYYAWSNTEVPAGVTVKGNVEGVVVKGNNDTMINATTLNVENIDFNAAGKAVYITNGKASDITFTDCSFTGQYAFHVDSANNAKLTFNNCEFNGATTFAASVAEVDVNGGEINDTFALRQNASISDVAISENALIGIIDDQANVGTKVAIDGCRVVDAEGDASSKTVAELVDSTSNVVTVDGNVIYGGVAKIGDVHYSTLQAALDAAAAGTGNVTVEILSDINLTGTDWNPVTVSAPGYPFVTVNGNGKTITGLNDMLFAGTWAGKSGLVINDLTIADSTIVNDENDSKGNVGVGAFIGYPQASETITLNNCHLKNSTVNGGHWTGGLVGYAAGYAGPDGPVFMTLTITNCSVTASTITGKGSTGGIIGHGSGNAWTDVIIVDSVVSGNTITSTGSSNNKAGSVMGTIGAAGQPTTVNGVTKTGGMAVSVSTAGNTVKSADTDITTIYGRQGTPTGLLEVTGGTYEAYPIEEGVSYAAPTEGYIIKQNDDGTYGVAVDPAYGKVAKIGDTYYKTLDEAFDAAEAGDAIKLLANVGTDAAIQVAKQVTIDLNGKTIAATENDKVGDGVFCVVKGGDLTINDSVGTGTINGKGGNDYNIAIWANGGKVTINGGNFTNRGAEDSSGNPNFDLIYVKDGGEVVIYGGHFECETPAFTLNSHDTLKGTITVNGGTFVGFDPRNNAAETAGTTFMAPGKYTLAEGGSYSVVTPTDYILNGAASDAAAVDPIDAALAGAVTVTKDGDKITATATYTFKVTAVDTVNPEKSSYELNGGKLRPGKTVAVKYIDLVTGTESWDKPEADTVTFKLVIK